MTELPHGFDVDSLARMAAHVARTHPGRFLDFDELQDVAAVALVAFLYEAETPPTRKELYQAASSAVGGENNRYATFLGVDRNAVRSNRTGMPPGYVVYWRSDSVLSCPWEESVVERIAVVQVWERLAERHRVVLRALAEYGTAEAARDSLNISYGAWHNRLGEARRRARQLWHAPEPAPPQWGRDRVGAERGNRAIKALARRRGGRIEKETAA